MPERTAAQPLARRARRRMRRVTREGSSTPLSPPDTQNAPKGAFCVSGGERGVDEPSRVRQFCLEQNWTAEGWPRSAQREGVGPMDGPNNPSRTSRNGTAHRSRRSVCLTERSVDGPSRVTRRILRLALRASDSPFAPQRPATTGDKLSETNRAPAPPTHTTPGSSSPMRPDHLRDFTSPSQK